MLKTRIATALLLLAAPLTVLAHAGSMKVAGDVDVVGYQTPISPLVGERVRMTFVFTKHDLNDQLGNLPVSLDLIRAFYGDESKDTLVLHRDLVTDANGSAQFDYAFADEKYYDVELTFNDTTGHKQTTGFLVQPREQNPVRGLALFVAGAVVALLAQRILKR